MYYLQEALPCSPLRILAVLDLSFTFAGCLMEDFTELFGIVERYNELLSGLQKPHTQYIGVYEAKVLFS